MLAIAMNDLRLLFRDKAAAFFTFVFPVLFAIFFTFVFGGAKGGGKMKVAVLDLDGTAPSAQLVRDLEADSSLEARRAATLDEGRMLVQKGSVTALIVVPEGFEAGTNGLFTGGKIPLEAYVDPSRSAEAGLLTGKLNELAFRQMSSAFTDRSKMAAMLTRSREQLGTIAPEAGERREAFLKFFDGADALSGELEKINAGAGDAAAGGVSGGGGAGFNPVDVKVRDLEIDRTGKGRTSSDYSFPQGIAWGLMGSVVGFAASIAAERRRGTLIRLATSPLTRSQILAGKAMACFVTCMLVQVLLIGIAIGMGSQIGSWPMLSIAVVCSSLGFVGIAMGLAPFADSEEGAAGIARAVPMILAMIGGGTIPLAFMPPFLETLSSVSPFKWAIVAVEGGMWRGFTAADMLLPCGILLGVGAVAFVIGVKRLRWE
ncbi:MAG: ABC transporter permease [Tepidisphaera sp.]